MKRIISLVLTMVLLVACLAVPVLADEVNLWDNVLDYGYAIGYGSNIIPLSNADSEGRVYVSYSVPYKKYYYIDLYVMSDASDLEASRYSSSSYFSVDNIRGNLYHVYGWLNSTGDTLGLYFHYSSGSYVEIVSFQATLADSALNTISSVHGAGYAYKYPTNTALVLSGLNEQVMWTYSNYEEWELYNGSFSLYFDIPDWKSYDFVDLEISMLVKDISSISASVGTRNVPFTVNFIEAEQNFSFFMVCVRLDLTGLTNDLEDEISVLIQGNGIWDADGAQRNIVTLRNCVGYVVPDQPSMWAFWFSNLQEWLSSGFSSLSESLELILDGDFQTLGDNINTWILDQTTTLHDTTEYWGDQTRVWLSNVYNMIKTLNTNMVTEIYNFKSSVGTWFTNQTNSITSSISSWAQSIIDSITSGADRIVAALSPNGSADDFNDKVQQQGSTLEGMAGAMGAVTRPDVSTAIPDISGYLTVTGPVTLASVFAPFWDNSYILRLLLASLAVSVAFTVVYGGKK